jgi:hypothetical protein
MNKCCKPEFLFVMAIFSALFLEREESPAVMEDLLSWLYLGDAAQRKEAEGTPSLPLTPL